MWKKKTPIQVWSWDLCAWKSFIHTTKKVCAFFHDPEWCHLFTLECFEQELRKPIKSLALLLASRMACNKLLSHLSALLFEDQGCVTTCPQGGMGVLWHALHQCLPFHSICLSQRHLVNYTSCPKGPPLSEFPLTLWPPTFPAMANAGALAAPWPCLLPCCLPPHPPCPSHGSPLFSFASVQILFFPFQAPLESHIFLDDPSKS